MSESTKFGACRTIEFSPALPEAQARAVIAQLGGTVPEQDEHHLIETAPKHASRLARGWRGVYALGSRRRACGCAGEPEDIFEASEAHKAHLRTFLAPAKARKS